MLAIFRVDAEVLSSDDDSPLASKKYFLELREGKTINSSMAKVKMSYDFKYLSLEPDSIMWSR